MKRLLLSLVCVLVVFFASAQEKKDTTYWTNGGMFAINFNQVSFSNWAAGGLNSV
jgi:hypothetical protein